MNIKYYGLGGKHGGDFKDEKRDRHLVDFLSSDVLNSDIAVFEEIVDVNRFVKNIIQGRLRCTSYDDPNERHQHVVICYKNDFRLEKEPGDQNYIIEEAKLGREKSRPAVYGLLKHKDGTPLFHIVGLHLKAYPDESTTRVEQSRVISKRLAELRDGTPYLLLGDYNTYRAPKNGQQQDDVDLISQTYQQFGMDVTHLRNQSPFTYKNGKYEMKLDHIWIGKSVEVIKPLRSLGICSNESHLIENEQNKKYKNIKYYNKNISDHCPITTTVQIKRY